MRPPETLAAAWRRWRLWRRQFTGGADVLNALYERADPWNLATADERQRFAATDALIRTRAPHAASILEIGCGEGLQTRHLAQLAAHVTGIDISPTAVARARAAVPDATFLAGDLADLLPALPRRHYDVATLCEVLYYMPDPAAAVAHAQRLADHVVVTVYRPLARRLEQMLRSRGFTAGPVIAAGRKRWKTYVWMETAR